MDVVHQAMVRFGRGGQAIDLAQQDVTEVRARVVLSLQALQEALLPEEELLCVAADLRRRSRRDDRGHLRPLAAVDVEAAQELRVLELGPAALRIRALELAVTLAAASSHQGVHLSIWQRLCRH